ncbi:MAG: DNA translocase FtsK 4TM domain-containing protein, partial [Acetivibrio ethanolgignens]
MAAKKNKKNTVETNPYRDEIILVVTLIVSVLLALSTFNLAGVFGKIINHLLFGLFGFLAYLLPYALFFGVAFAISNQGSHVARVKIFSSTGLFLILCALLQLIFGGYDKGQKLLEIYKLCAEGKKDGGLIGGIIVKALCYIFGTAGTYAILIGLTLILIMLITERLLFASIRRKRMQAKEERMIQAREREAA